MDESNLFDRSQANNKDFADEEWQEWDNDGFGSAYADVMEPLPSQISEDDAHPVGASNNEYQNEEQPRGTP